MTHQKKRRPRITTLDVVLAVLLTMVTTLSAVSLGAASMGFDLAAHNDADGITPGEQTEPAAVSAQEETPETEPPVALYPVPLDEALQIHIIEQAEANHIDPAIVFAMAGIESGYDPNAVGDDGEAWGLCQVQPKWHYARMQRLDCTDLLNPYQNATVAVDFLAEQMERYNGNIAKALTAYNMGHYDGTVTEYAMKVLELAQELRCEVE